MRLTIAALLLALTSSAANAETIADRASIIDADTLALADWIGAGTVSCETTRKDRHGRGLARCLVSAIDLAE